MQLIDGRRIDAISIDRFPFVIGRSAECNLALSQSFVSRSHAVLVREGEQLVVEDMKSRHGTFVNGERITRHTLRPHDSVQFGSREGPKLIFKEAEGGELTNQTILEQLQEIGAQRSDLEKLRWFLRAAQQLNSAGAVDGVMTSLLETTLALAKVERGYVFLLNVDGVLELTLGMDASGNAIQDASTVSRTVMRRATEGTDQFIVTDSLTAEDVVPQSILANSIHTIICIPLRRSRQTLGGEGTGSTQNREVFGALYLESHLQMERVSDVDHELLRTIAREAAALVDNAQLAAQEEEARQHRKELQIAAGIQQGLMAVRIPALNFAEIHAYNAACSAVGGDFFDVVPVGGTVSIALVDVSGKGISAAILASTLQGMLYVQLQSGQPLEAIASATNQYLCNKNVGKYATMVLLRLHEDGRLDYINCGHIQPRLCSDTGVARLQAGNLPVGLLSEASYAAETLALRPGSRVILVSDGVTEAEDAQGNCFGEEGLDSASVHPTLENMRQRVADFCGDQPATDDCTIVQVTYRGGSE
jgi:serine phosphatase RsbU (regulator of sigma subunit)/pSer/pThr/pTyr-binding forkhead associated (FHA) protein